MLVSGLADLAGSSNVHNYSLAQGVTKTFSSSLLGDFRFGYFKYNPVTNKPDAGTTAMTNFGIPNANMGDNFTSGLGEFDMDGISSAGDSGTNFGDGLGVARCNCPLIESEQQFQWVGNMTKMKGNHQFKFGADVRYAQNLRVPSDSNRTGVYSFSHLATSDDGDGGTGLGRRSCWAMSPTWVVTSAPASTPPSGSIACSTTPKTRGALLRS